MAIASLFRSALLGSRAGLCPVKQLRKFTIELILGKVEGLNNATVVTVDSTGTTYESEVMGMNLKMSVRR